MRGSCTSTTCGYWPDRWDISRLFFFKSKRFGAQLTLPTSHEPPLRFGTVPNTHTEAALRQHYPEMFNFMKQFNRSEIAAGVEAVKRGFAPSRFAWHIAQHARFRNSIRRFFFHVRMIIKGWSPHASPPISIWNIYEKNVSLNNSLLIISLMNGRRPSWCFIQTIENISVISNSHWCVLKPSLNEDPFNENQSPLYHFWSFSVIICRFWRWQYYISF